MPEPGNAAPKEGGPAQSGPPAGPLENLNAMIEDVRIIGVRLFADVFALLQAQWQLSAYVLTGSLAIWVLRLRAHVAMELLAIVTWVFVNVTVWELVASLTTLRFAAPLSLVLLNGLTIWAIDCWQKRLRLQ